MSLTLGQYQLILRPVNGGNKEYVIGEFTFDVRPGNDEGTVDFYDVQNQLDEAITRVLEVPPATETAP